MKKELFKRVGIEIGHFTDKGNLTGTTVFVAREGADIGIDVRGSSTGSFNLDAYSNQKSARRFAHAIVLTGGSSFGLESVFGAMQYLEEQKVGNPLKNAVIPGITGAAIYDLNVGDPTARPTKAYGYEAAKSASADELREGSIGVGTGATTGKWGGGRDLKGGFGMGEVTLPNGIVVCSFVVTNAVGDVVNPTTEKFYYDGGGFGNSQIDPDKTPEPDTNTTLAVVATNASLYRSQLTKVADLAHDGMARSIYPVHTMNDGDIVFAVSSQTGERKGFSDLSIGALTDQVGIAASEALAKAIKSSIVHATGAGKYPSYSFLYPHGNV